MHVVENKERLKYAINTGIKRSGAQLFAPSSALAEGGIKFQNRELQNLQSPASESAIPSGSAAVICGKACLSVAARVFF